MSPLSSLHILSVWCSIWHQIYRHGQDNTQWHKWSTDAIMQIVREMDSDFHRWWMSSFYTFSSTGQTNSQFLNLKSHMSFLYWLSGWLDLWPWLACSMSLPRTFSTFIWVFFAPLYVWKGQWKPLNSHILSLRCENAVNGWACSCCGLVQLSLLPYIITRYTCKEKQQAILSPREQDKNQCVQGSWTFFSMIWISEHPIKQSVDISYFLNGQVLFPWTC